MSRRRIKVRPVPPPADRPVPFWPVDLPIPFQLAELAPRRPAP